MTRPKKSTKAPAKRKMTITAEEGEQEHDTMARVLVSPFLRHGVLNQHIATKGMGELPGDPNFDDFGKVIAAKAQAVLDGDLTMANELLVAQALSLDALFGEMARRAAMNMGDYPQAAERYARLAFKAQSNSRAAIEALVKMHQPREQTVRHVHVNEGGQAVIADSFHHHAGGTGNEKSNGQPHATGTAGESAPMLGQDPKGNGVPIASGEGQRPMPDARRKGKRTA